MSGLELYFWLTVGHALADYPLQGDFIAQAKNRHTAPGALFWRWVLPTHGLIHGGFVALVTGSVLLGVAEAVAHSAIDYAKCEGWLSFDADQLLHLACKVCWAAIAVWWLA
jgi:hypothetical protein